jgi:hypothetical protein
VADRTAATGLKWIAVAAVPRPAANVPKKVLAKPKPVAKVAAKAKPVVKAKAKAKPSKKAKR